MSESVNEDGADAPRGRQQPPPSPFPSESGSAPAAQQTPEPLIGSSEWLLQSAGSPSPRALELLDGYPTTRERWSRTSPDGITIYRPERAALHEGIVTAMLDDHRPSIHPEALFTAGGAASGKTTVLQGGLNPIPPDAVIIDADAVKAQLPEYVILAGEHDRYAAAAVHEESSFIAQRLRQEAARRGINLVVDTVGGGPPGVFVGKLRELYDAGYQVTVIFVDAPVDTAIQRAVDRAPSTARAVPEEALRIGHVQACGRLHEWISEPFIDRFEVWSTNVPEGAPPLLVAEGGGGTVEVIDEAEYARILNKGAGG
jgi:predicted ABC-type ATPase